MSKIYENPLTLAETYYQIHSPYVGWDHKSVTPLLFQEFKEYMKDEDGEGN